VLKPRNAQVKPDDRQTVNMGQFYCMTFVGREYRLISTTRVTQMLESADEDIANLLNLFFSNLSADKF